MHVGAHKPADTDSPHKRARSRDAAAADKTVAGKSAAATAIDMQKQIQNTERRVFSVTEYSVSDRAMLKSPYLNPSYLPSNRAVVTSEENRHGRTRTTSTDPADDTCKNIPEQLHRPLSQPQPATGPEGFNTSEFNFDDQQVTLRDVASLFLHERRKITHHLRERDELKHQIDELRRERDVITLHYRAKTEELDKKQKESNEKDRLFAQQKAAVASLETQLSETREYLGATKEEFSKLDKLSKDLPKIKEQRDALVHTLTQLETEKAVLLDQLKKISNANIEKETKAISAANTQTKDLKSSRPPSANRARPVTRPSTRQGLDDGLAPQSTDSGDILRLSTLNTELTTSVGEINLVEADIESLRNNDSFKSAIQLAQERDTLLDRLKRAEIERIKLKSLLNRAKAAPAPTLEEPTKSEEKEKDKKGQSKETKKDKKKDQEEKKEREKEREKETQEAERKLLDQQQKFLEMKELYESVLSREKELKVELERTKLEPSEAEALRHEHLHVIELVEREQVLKNELDKTKGDVAILNEKLNMANKSALENAVNTSNSSGMSATKLKAILDQQSLHEVKSKSLEKEIESSQKKYTDLVKDYGKVCKQLDQRTVEENAQHKSLVMMLEKAQDEKTKIAEELQKVKEDDIKSMSKIMEEKGRLEAFINALKRQLYEKVETIKQEQSKLEKLGDDEKEILNEIRMDEEALVVNEAFLDASRKNNESGRVGELMVQNEKIRSHKILKERELNKTQEKKRAQELLLQELKVLRDYKAQHDGLITSIEKAKAANKMVLVTPQGVITTTMAELKKELLQVAKKKEDLESQMPLPEGWERLVDPSGKMYFMNQATKTVQWVHPLSRQATREESSHQESNNALSGLTNGWEEVYDEKHGKFFMNKKTRETTFIDPRLTIGSGANGHKDATADNGFSPAKPTSQVASPPKRK